MSVRGLYRLARTESARADTTGKDKTDGMVVLEITPDDEEEVPEGCTFVPGVEVFAQVGKANTTLVCGAGCFYSCVVGVRASRLGQQKVRTGLVRSFPTVFHEDTNFVHPALVRGEQGVMVAGERTDVVGVSSVQQMRLECLDAKNFKEKLRWFASMWVMCEQWTDGERPRT
jgi:hypothetical protein